MTFARRTAHGLAALGILSLALPGQQASSSALLRSVLDRSIATVQERVEGSFEAYEEHSSWDDPWVFRGTFYEVRNVQSYALGRELATGLDQMLEKYRETLGLDFVPTEPFLVRVYPDRGSYNQFGDAASGEHSSFFGSFHAVENGQSVVAVEFTPNMVWLKIQATHSAVHQYLAAAFPGRTLPTVVDEGLASYFSMFWNFNWGLEQFEKLKASRNGLVPTRRLLSDTLQAYQPGTAGSRFFQLAATFSYLLNFREDTRTTRGEDGDERGPFRDYLVAVLNGRETTDLPMQQILDEPDELDAALRAYEFPR